MGTHLVPDLDEELMWALVRIEELLLTLAAAEHDRTQPVRMPSVVSEGRALRSLCRAHAALGPTQTAGDVPGLSSRGTGADEHAAARTARRRPVWVGADGQLLRPLGLAELDPADLTVLSRTATSLGYELALRPGGELARALAAGAESVAELSAEAPTAVELVASLARILGLLDLETTDDAALLVRRLHGIVARGGTARLELTEAEQDAHRRTVERMTDMWGGCLGYRT